MKLFLYLTILIVADHLLPGGEVSGDASLAFLPLLAMAAFGLYSGIQQKQAADAQAKAIQQQAQLDAEMARRQAEADAQAESAQVDAMRDDQRRRRAAIEAGYAKAGVLLEGTPASLLENQAVIDETNVREVHRAGNERRNLIQWQSGAQGQMANFQASVVKRQGVTSFISGIADTGINTMQYQRQRKAESLKWYQF